MEMSVNDNLGDGQGNNPSGKYLSGQINNWGVVHGTTHSYGWGDGSGSGRGWGNETGNGTGYGFGSGEGDNYSFGSGHGRGNHDYFTAKTGFNINMF